MRGKTISLLLACALAAPALGKPAARKPAARPAVARAAPAAIIVPLPDTPETQALRRAYAFALPIYDMMRARHLAVTKAEAAGGAGVNRLYADITLPDATTHSATPPNIDTINASAWLDLAGGPVFLETPTIPGRYNSATLTDLFTDTVAIVGTSSHDGGGRTMIVGPAWQGQVPPKTTLIRSTTNDAWLLVRVLVNGPADLPAAAGLLRAFTLDVPKDNAVPVPTSAVPTATPDAATLLAVVDEALARGPLPAGAQARLAPLAELGIVAGAPPADAATPWGKSLPALRAEIKASPDYGDEVDGWVYPGAGIGNFGADDAGRAKVAAAGLGALPRTEAIILTTTKDKDGAPLSGKLAYTVHIPAKPPIGAFWSLTLYQEDANGRLVFVDTPSKRYAVGDRTPELRAERDGGYDIFVQAQKPTGERVVNWLPAPAGSFRLVFRAFLPGAAFLDGSFRLPPVVTSEVVP